jgi:hypothetical protein
MTSLRKSDAPRPRYRKVLEEVLPTLEYAELQARYTHDRLVRDSEPALKGTVSGLTILLQEAVAKVREALA